MTKPLHREIGHKTSRFSLLTQELNLAIKHAAYWDLHEVVREAVWAVVYKGSCRATDTLHLVLKRTTT